MKQPNLYSLLLVCIVIAAILTTSVNGEEAVRVVQVEKLNEQETERRSLLAPRVVEERRLKGWKKVGKSIKKVGESIGKGIKDGLNQAFKGKFITRDDALWNEIKSIDTSDLNKALNKMLGGFKSMADYVDKQLLKDLSWLGKQLEKGWDAFCSQGLAKFGAVYACSYGLWTGTCAATGFLFPFCTPAQKVAETLINMLAAGIARTIVRCSIYQAMKDTIGTCSGNENGIAMYIASKLDDIWIGDPFTPICETSMEFACGDSPGRCSYQIDPLCTGSGYKNMMKDLANVIDSL